MRMSDMLQVQELDESAGTLSKMLQEADDKFSKAYNAVTDLLDELVHNIGRNKSKRSNKVATILRNIEREFKSVSDDLVGLRSEISLLEKEGE